MFCPPFWVIDQRLSEPLPYRDALFIVESDAQDAVPHLVHGAVLGEDAQLIPHGLDEVFGIKVFGVTSAEGGAEVPTMWQGILVLRGHW